MKSRNNRCANTKWMFKPVFIFLMLATSSCVKFAENDIANLTISEIREEFNKPSAKYGPRCFWWWLNGYVTKESITSDLEAMNDKGFSGALIFDAKTTRKDMRSAPVGPTFSSSEWTSLYLHALREADRLGLELGLSIQSGWNIGGPSVTLEDRAKIIIWSEVEVEENSAQIKLPTPETNFDWYKDICVLAYPKKANSDREPIRDLKEKAAFKEVGKKTVVDLSFLLNSGQGTEGEEDVMMEDIIDLTADLKEDGTLAWEVPSGKWEILRIGYTPSERMVSTSSPTWQGHIIDYLNPDALKKYWYENIDSMLVAAGDLAGTALKYVHSDSWECKGMNWTPRLEEAFYEFNDYEIRKYLPIICGKIINNRSFSTSFLADFRKTLGHLVSNHYQTFAELASEYNMGTHPECSGPHAGPFDGIKNYSHSEILMSEFWSPSSHRPEPNKRFFVKQAASAAHIYGKKLVGAEAFTTVRKPHWSDKLWFDMKPHFDYEVTAGLNLTFFHTFTASPKEMGKPGLEYFAGTHVNPNVTWWEMSNPFMDYFKRVHSVVQNGTFVADVLYYYGDHVPNIALYKGANAAGSYPGYDYDTTNEEVLLRSEVENGKIKVPGGITYRLLLLPEHKVLSLEALKKVEALLKQGATVLGNKPEKMVTLKGGEMALREFHSIADRLWGQDPTEQGQKKVGEGTLAWGLTSREYLAQEGVAYDFEVLGEEAAEDFEYIHYRIGTADVYYLSNQTAEHQEIDPAFRVAGKQPEIWDPITGTISKGNAYAQAKGRTTVPLELQPFGSLFVVFEDQIPTTQQGKASTNFVDKELSETLGGSWELAFDTLWGGPNLVEFDSLMDWRNSDDEGIKFYSGEATYSKNFNFTPATGSSYWLRLNQIEDVGIARVSLNDEVVGITWTKPYELEISDFLRNGENQLEVTVVNSWLNRLIGDRELAESDRFTKTNIKRGLDQWTLAPSGLLGPVEIYQEVR